ncbi:MAG: hypothetical protein EXR20_04975 [Bacteroidetes bacterium]|jgi:hypothetical protein|nr:hypothetical protein [Bacteroidota bacterium]
MPTLQPTFTVYKLITPYAYRDCKKMGGIGVSGCLEWVTRNFKVGDTLISSQSLSPYSNPLTFVDGRLFSGGVEQQVRIPLSVLNKVATNIDASQLNTYINSGNQNNTGTTTNNTKTTTDSTKFVWTPIKKVVAGALIIGAIYGILKLTKVI